MQNWYVRLINVLIFGILYKNQIILWMITQYYINQYFQGHDPSMSNNSQNYKLLQAWDIKRPHQLDN